MEYKFAAKVMKADCIFASSVEMSVKKKKTIQIFMQFNDNVAGNNASEQL